MKEQWQREVEAAQASSTGSEEEGGSDGGNLPEEPIYEEPPEVRGDKLGNCG